MVNYVYIGNQENGKIGVSSYVFIQIAKDTINDLCSSALKKSIKFDEQKDKVTVRDDKKGGISINVTVTGYKGVDIAKACSLIQKEIYTSINGLLELSALKINVSVSSLEEYHG